MKETSTPWDNENGLAERIAYLIAGFIRGTLTEAEHSELDRWVEASNVNMRLFEELTDESNIEAGQLWFQRREAMQEAKKSALHEIKERAGLRNTVPFYRHLWPYAAALVLLIFVGLTFWKRHVAANNEKPTITAQTSRAPVKQDNILLTLSDGRTVALNSTNKSVLADGANVQKKGTLVYHPNQTGEGKYNTLSVPRGAQYQVVLADGTAIWLNAESTLRYPISFTGNTRTVTLVGEGYFEVAKDASQPFRVQTGMQVVQVLGTHFNINGYGDDGAIRTTLLEGSVLVEQGTNRTLLKPGEQSQAREQGLSKSEVAVGDAVSWKEGVFLFRNAPIQIVASQIKRWYGVEITYGGTVQGHFNATINRTEPLTRLLAVLEGSGFVHFQLHENKLLIQP